MKVRQRIWLHEQFLPATDGISELELVLDNGKKLTIIGCKDGIKVKSNISLIIELEGHNQIFVEAR